LTDITLKKLRRPLKGEVVPPPDKSISHRAAIFAALAKGKSRIKNYLKAADTISTLYALKALGVEIEEKKDLLIRGKGLHGLKEPEDVINCGNSGTTMRLFSGLLSGNNFFSVLTGDGSLRSRPMGRVILPLSEMGACITARGGNRYPPLSINGGRLKGITYEMPVASAQVKSALILAGLYAKGRTEIIEPASSRDHTEKMLSAMGADIKVKGNHIKVKAGKELSPIDLTVPGDFSSAAFFIVAALIVLDSDILIRNVGVNDKRTGLLNVLERMGAKITLLNKKIISGEPVAELYVRAVQELKPAEVQKDEIPLLIDEVPILSITMAMARGESVIKGAEELRVKESDRLAAVAQGLKKMGTRVKEYKDGLSIRGGVLKGASIKSFGDHRIAMAFSIAALAAEGKTTIENADAVGISYPEFFSVLKKLSRG
jgi:3-phosphoshikimate 1-carboxyvinyltransferase